MRRMQLTRKLIQQFLEGRCSPEEEALIRDWLREDPEQLSRLMTEESWNAFVPETTSVEASPKMFEYIVQHTQPKIKKWKWMAAASITVLLASSVFYFTAHRQPLVELTVQTKPVLKTITDSAVAATQQYTLPDGSIAILSPGSSIRYDSVFVKARNIMLTGEASFSVAKDSSKPFCVHTKNINVTALGTMFSVSDRDSLLTSVKLFEGKVVVRNETHVQKKLKDVIMHPGQELKFNNKDFSYRLNQFKEEKQAAKNSKIEKIQKRPAEILRFNNQPLQDIFSELQKQYNIKITFTAGTSEDLRFTGTHNPVSETLEEFLSTIAMLNDLKVKRTRSAFVISPN